MGKKIGARSKYWRERIAEQLFKNDHEHRQPQLSASESGAAFSVYFSEVGGLYDHLRSNATFV